MKILVVSSNGKVGSLVAKELVSRGHQVTGLSRSANKNDFLTHYLQKDVLELTATDVLGYEAVISAFGILTGDLEEAVTAYHQVNSHLLKVLANSPATLYFVGGAGSLVVEPKTGLRLFETPDFPKEYYAIAAGHANSLVNDIRVNTQVNWVFVSPAAIFDDAGEFSRNVVIAGSDFTVNNKGESYISYIDYAWELANQVEAKKLNRAWVSFRTGNR
ncbi:NAD(P)-dependent oxidoreductase [Psittacicella gerlachiana]|uniref:NAD(P)-binding domain-containing protein n=1 Tax=Psittacicella gerlachiana TaxID=2028574 RepID=A0A3A1YAA3_9GAMM|nr:NAD(P)H-binding protein [Psittacicella gerlachiana]RIY34605.1 hypothetical protein CKF59_05280 [Psittacicella gerlachiana]